MLQLPPDYIAGFVDGEGCFALKLRKDVKRNRLSDKIREYLYWATEFAITLRKDDYEVLEHIRDTLQCGAVSYASNKQARFSVQGTRELAELIIPFFNEHKLYGKKRNDYELWKEAVLILYKYRDGTLNVLEGKRGFARKELHPRDTERLYEIRKDMLQYKSSRSRPFLWGTTNT